MKLPILTNNTLRYNLRRSTIHRLNVGLHQCLKISVAGGDTSAAGCPSRDNELLELLVARSHTPVHLLGDDLAHGVASLRALAVDAKEGVDLGLNALAEVEMVGRVVTESLLLGVAEGVLAMTGLVTRLAVSEVRL